MDFKKYYIQNKTFLTYTDQRIRKMIELVGEYKPEMLLDVGCGNGYFLEKLKKKYPRIKLFGIDVYKTSISEIDIRTSDITKGLPYENDYFNCIVLGEVIEHVPDPDYILKEVRRILKRNGLLIISTPNLVSWANRIIFPLGIQPFFTETSSEINLGRRFKILGQGGKVQGHLKIFTYKSLKEILIKEGFTVERKMGVPFFFPFPISVIDKIFTYLVPLSSGLLYVARKK